MGKPITTQSNGICFAFPNVCLTPSGPSMVPIPYPSVGQLSSVQDPSDSVYVGGNPVVTRASSIATTRGDSAGTGGGVRSGTFGGEVKFKTHSGSVFASSSEVVRMFDQTEQNSGNAVGVVLGGVPTVLVGD